MAVTQNSTGTHNPMPNIRKNYYVNPKKNYIEKRKKGPILIYRTFPAMATSPITRDQFSC